MMVLGKLGLGEMGQNHGDHTTSLGANKRAVISNLDRSYDVSVDVVDLGLTLRPA